MLPGANFAGGTVRDGSTVRRMVAEEGGAGILVVGDVVAGGGVAVLAGESGVVGVGGSCSCTDGQGRKEAGETVLRAGKGRLLCVGNLAWGRGRAVQGTGSRRVRSCSSEVDIRMVVGNIHSTAQDGCTALGGQASTRILFISSAPAMAARTHSCIGIVLDQDTFQH